MPSSISKKSWLPSSPVLWTIRLLCLVGLSISGYLAWTSFQAGEVFGCSGGDIIDCEHVLHSKYAKVLGIPVSVPAFALYATLLAVSFYFRKTTPEGLLKAGWILFTVGSLSAAGAAVWFSGLQFSDGKFCPYCLGAHACGILLALLVFLKSPLNNQTYGGFAAMAMAGVLGLVAIQWQSEAPPTYTIETYTETSGSDQVDSSEEFGAPAEFAPPGSGEAEEFGAPFTFNPPADAAPPVFDAPGVDSSKDDDQEKMDQSRTNFQPAQYASLVPAPIDLAKADQQPEPTETASADDADSAIETPEPAADDQSQRLPASADVGQQTEPENADTNVASATNRSNVEFTPPMEVPVIFSQDSSDAQSTDFQAPTERPSAPKQEGSEAEESTIAIPSTSQNTDSGSTSNTSELTANAEPAGFQLLDPPKSLPTSVKAMSYLFFSASGANNAAISEVLMFNAQLQEESQAKDKAADDAKKADAEKVAPKEDRLVVVAGNRFSLNPKHWPLIGKPDADFIFVEMFDYTCPHCRVTHKAIEGAFEEYGDRLAVITLPVPLERACNSTVNGMGTAGACDMAKLAVAVWRIDQAKFEDYHKYMCSNQRSVFAARTKAEELVGKKALDKEMALPFATDYIKKHVELYKRVGQGSVPKLMFPRSTMTGEIQQASVLVNAIKRELEQ